ncbi:hypothetical protein GCM10007416_31560 [Kroppenstedtia guangzhouensis]|uniref:Uncharacterized protein n=1 Tax=Kroppenstedtia guangzhouensis TaxID=1274356 RepID=A0ABQ1H3E6_9BACL|nr:hypothetical protein [Kroppenstedtia guangzhouensis]GGA56079.1 hypothetical protein GCM10007416_31560 [Kroppenstedtia guangzhouensis]
MILDQLKEKYLEAQKRLMEKDQEHEAFSRKNSRYLEKVLNTQAWFEAYETFEEQSGYNEAEDAFIAAEVELISVATGMTRDEVFRTPIKVREQLIAQLFQK